MNTESQACERSATPLHVLLIEDCAEDAEAVSRDLSRSTRPSFALRRAASWAEARAQVGSGRLPDLVLLDLNLPDAEGLPLVRSAIESIPGVPVVIMTGLDQDQLALAALQAGAQDYLVKSDIGSSSALRRSIRHALERHQILESLERATRERIEMKDQLLNHVSHELLTPLSAIYQFIDILRGTLSARPAEVAAQQQRCLDVLLRNAVQLRRMIGDLMEATRIDTGKLQLELSLVDVRACLEQAVSSALPDAEQRELELRTQLEADLPPVLADEARLCQIAANLLSNAIKFTSRGGHVTVRAQRAADPGRLHFSVIDTGRGIRREVLPHVFERLYQDRESSSGSRKGLGLGLFICQEIIHALGGRVWAESEYGVGSEFHVELPIYSTERLFAEHLNPHEPAALILLTVGAPGPRAPCRVAEELLGEIHGLLPRLVLGHFDLILPRRKTPGGEVMAVVARTDGPGAQAMGARLARSVGELRDQLSPGCAIAVRGQALQNSGKPESSAAALAAEVEAVLAAARAGAPAPA